MEEQRYIMRGQITVVNMPGEVIENNQNKCVHQVLVLVSQALVCVNVCIIHLHLLLQRFMNASHGRIYIYSPDDVAEYGYIVQRLPVA